MLPIVSVVVLHLLPSAAPPHPPVVLHPHTLLQGMHPQLMQLLNSKHNRTTTNALCKCNAIFLLNKALLQGMHPQLMQLLNLKHCFDTTNALAVLLLAAAAAAGAVITADNVCSHCPGNCTLQTGHLLSIICSVGHLSASRGCNTHFQ